jgi:hypothetical protein
MAKALGPLAHGVHNSRYEPTSMFELRRRWALWLPIERNGEFGTSPFFGQLFGRASARLNILRMPNIGVSEIKNNRSKPLFCVMRYVYFIYVACSRQVPSRRFDQLAPEM